MDYPSVEHGYVSGLHAPAQDLIGIAVALDIGERHPVVVVPVPDLIAIVSRQGTKVLLPVPLVPAMRPPDELQRALAGHWHQRCPRRTGVEAVHRPIRLVL